MGPLMVVYAGRTTQQLIWEDVWFLNTGAQDKYQPQQWSWESVSVKHPPAALVNCCETALLSALCSETRP